MSERTEDDRAESLVDRGRGTADRPPGSTVDVVVIGGGPAGIAAALWAARYRRCVLLVDAAEHRNAAVDATHGYLGLDRIAPRELISIALSDLLQYPEVQVE